MVAQFYLNLKASNPKRPVSIGDAIKVITFLYHLGQTKLTVGLTFPARVGFIIAKFPRLILIFKKKEKKEEEKKRRKKQNKLVF